MDIQCVSVLPRVCEVLAASGSSLPDDTKHPSMKIESHDIERLYQSPGILSFTLKLTGLIAASEDGFKALELIFDPHHWKEAGLWEDPCLRIGWIQGLRKMLQHSKALRLFVQADLIEPLLQLQTDSSLFVSSAANQLLAHVLLLYQSLSSAGCNGANKRDLEHSGVSEQTIISCSGIITNVSEYLKKSLLPDSRSFCSDLHMDLICFYQQAPDCLPCPQRLIVAAVLTFLRLCRGDSSSSSTACVEVSRFVTGTSHPLLTSSEKVELLDSLSGTVAIHREELFTALLLLGLMQAVRKRACDIRWEARDSTVEFLGHLAEVCPIGEEREPLKTLLGSCSFTIPLLKEALQDPESYVRASSIATLAQTLTFSWQQGAALTQEQVVTQLQEILSQDSEGFARRAVVKFFTAWFSSCPSPTSCSLLMQSVPSVLSQGVADLDWEVKLHTLELAELLLDKTFPERLPLHPYAVISNQPHTCHAGENESDLLCSLNSLVDQGVVPALLCGLVDCDRPVALKACQLLIKLRDTVSSLLVNAADPRVSCMLPGQSWVQEMRGNKDAHTQGAPHVGVCEVLRTLDLDKKLSVLMQSSDHIYNSPLSLLQDILTASTAASNPNSDPGQEVIVDCY
uniref:BRCA1-associated ATM activator 1 n=1 Tax=Cyprinodon variegatus TaxID=28743 RepID=A0A3Q2D4B9_CYPVA